MTAFLLRFSGSFVVAAAVVACATTEQPLYAEYALDPGEHPESIDCYYDCLRSTRSEFRDACLAHCDGVVATSTATPCSPGAPALCRSYRIAEAEPADAESDDDTAGHVFLDILGLTLDVATGASDSNDEERKTEHTARSSSKRSSASSSGTSWGSKSGVGNVADRNSISKKRR